MAADELLQARDILVYIFLGGVGGTHSRCVLPRCCLFEVLATLLQCVTRLLKQVPKYLLDSKAAA